MKKATEKKEITSFEDLDCWQACRDVSRFVMRVIKGLPKSEQYDIVDNMRRAARSSTRNIAEGYGRFHYQENIQFCRVSRGSLTEILDDLISSRDEKYISEEEYNEGQKLISKALRILNGYINYLEKAKSTSAEPESIYTTE